MGSIYNVKMESIRKMSNFNFQWANTLNQNILSHIEFFFTLIKGYSQSCKGLNKLHWKQVPQVLEQVAGVKHRQSTENVHKKKTLDRTHKDKLNIIMSKSC